MRFKYGFLAGLALVVLIGAGEANRYINGTEIPRAKTLVYTSGAQAVTLGAITATSEALSGNETVGGTLGVSGAATLGSTMSVAATGTLSSDLVVVGSLAVTGAATLNSASFTWSSVEAGATCATGSAQGDGAMTTLAVQCTTVGSAGDCKTLPTAAVGKVAMACNAAAANAMDLFPATGAQINKENANTAISLAAGECAFCVGFSTTRWGCVIGSAN